MINPYDFSKEGHNKLLIQRLEHCIQNEIFFLPEGILIRESKKIDPLASVRKLSDYRFEFLGDQVGVGRFGTVSKVNMTLKITDDRQCVLKVKRSGFERVVKSQKSKMGLFRDPLFLAYTETFKIETIDESRFNGLTDYMHGKSPVFTKLQLHQMQFMGSFLVSRYFPGVNLDQLLIEECQYIRVVTIQQRLRLTLNLLRALSDLHERAGIVHRDIKPANIMIDQHFNVRIIDLGLGTEKNKPGSGSRGTPVYMPTEAYEIGENSQANRVTRDTFSMGLVVSEVWCAQKNFLLNESSSMSFTEKRIEMAKQNASVTIRRLFEGISLQALSYQMRDVISKVIYQMLDADPDKRCSLAEAISVFEDIQKDMLSDDEYKRAHTLALEVMDQVSVINKEFHANGQLYQTDYFKKLKEGVLGILERAPTQPYLDYFLEKLGIINACKNKSKAEVCHTIQGLFDYYALKFKKLELRKGDPDYFIREFKRHYYSLEALFAMKEKFERKTESIKILTRVPVSRHASCFFTAHCNSFNNLEKNAIPGLTR